MQNYVGLDRRQKISRLPYLAQIDTDAPRCAHALQPHLLALRLEVTTQKACVP